MKANAVAFINTIMKPKTVRWRLVLSFFATALHMLALLAQPLFVASVIRELVTHSEADVRLRVVGLAIAMGLSAVGAYWVAGLNNSVLQDARRDSKSALYASILTKPPEFFRTFNEGWIEAAIATASLAVRTIIYDCLGALIRAIFFIAFSTVLIFVTLPIYGLIFLLAAAIYLYLSYYLASRSSSYVSSAVTATTEASKEAADMLYNIDAVQCNNMISHEIKRLSGFLNIERKEYRTAQGIIDRGEFIQKFFLTVLFIAFVVTVTINARYDTATAIMFYIIGLLAYTQLDLVGKSMNSLFEQTHKLGTVLINLEYFDNKLINGRKNSGTGRFCTRISVSNASFFYNKDKPILENLSFDIESGARYLITGMSGAGKSTLIKVLTGQIRPQSGIIRIGTKDISELSFEEKASIMSIVTQNAPLFNRSIYENAVYGTNCSSYHVVEDLLISLKLERLKRGNPENWLNISVDKNGMALSGGEKQRILIARSILAERPILFLDEATSALDKATEKTVLNVLHERAPKSTIVAVSHHPHADLIGYNKLPLSQ